jgi:PAP2 superfamily protein
MAKAQPSLVNRLRAHWPAKLLLGGLLTTIFCTGYFLISYHPFRTPIFFPLTFIDRVIPFSPSWVWAYQSIYLLLLVAWLAEDSDQLKRYGIGFGLMMAVGFTFFLLWPVAGPRPIEATNEAMYRLLVRYDTTLNSFPSMHIALATYSACVALVVTEGTLRRVLIVTLPVWVALIAYATLATKQHYWIDLPPGIFLGWLAQLVAWRYRATSLKPAGAAGFVDEGVA